MNSPTPPRLYSNRSAIALLLFLGLIFASNHIAARIAFDHGTGLGTAILMRSGLTCLVLFAVSLILRNPWRLNAFRVKPRWAGALCGLIAIQSVFLYSAVARIPVALALLVFNLFPALFILLNWALDGKRPSARTLGLIALIVAGLALALDLPGQLAKPGVGSARFWAGVGFALGAASVFACALRVTERHLKAMSGLTRSLWTMAGVTLILSLLCILGSLGLFGEGARIWTWDGLKWPVDSIGWWGLAGLTLCYGFAFTSFFALIPRLNMPRNAPASNFEPVAALILGWALLGQSLQSIQLLGAGLVVLGIVCLAWPQKRP